MLVEKCSNDCLELKPLEIKITNLDIGLYYNDDFKPFDELIRQRLNAENIIMDRKHNSNSSVSNLLNLSDGLLSDCLKVQIICTFNNALSLVDNALLRYKTTIGFHANVVEN